MVILNTEGNSSVAILGQGREIVPFNAQDDKMDSVMNRSSVTLVTFGCAAAIAMALVGAAYAIDRPEASAGPLPKGDLIAHGGDRPATMLVLQDVNLSAGISTLVAIPQEPDRI